MTANKDRFSSQGEIDLKLKGHFPTMLQLLIFDSFVFVDLVKDV
jgi:hypothetical protein